MKHILNACAVAMMLFLSACAASIAERSHAPDLPTKAFTLLHTNDIHGHVEPWLGWEKELTGLEIGGLERIGGTIAEIRRQVGEKNVLLLDGGDTLGDTMIADLTKGQVVVDALNQMRYDAMVIGNHEPDFTAEVLKRHMSAARFPMLGANIRLKSGGQNFAPPYLIKTVGGVRVGILGIAYPNTALTTAKKNIQNLEFKGAPETVREFLPRLRAEGAELVIVLSHYGLSADKKLAEQVPGIDIIVGGHSHNRMKEVTRVGETIIVQAGAHGSDLGRLDIEFEDGKIARYRRDLITITNRVGVDPQVAATLAKYQSLHLASLNQPLGEAANIIARAQTLAGSEPGKRDEESPADSLFADIVREHTKADIALLPGVGYGVAIPLGPIIAKELRNLIPHESKVVTLQLTGKEVREILEQSLENTYTDDPKKKVGGLIQVSGLQFSYTDRANFPDRLKEVRVQNGQLDDAREYKVATNELLADGGHSYTTFLRGRNRKEFEPQYDIIKDKIKSVGTIRAPNPGRIQKK